MKAFPLDMSQYKRLFNSTRIPRQGKDELKASPGAPHVLVLRNGHMYCVDAVQPNGNVNYFENYVFDTRF